jgi:ABC-type branched-subunit amino acid transport system ATPase component
VTFKGKTMWEILNTPIRFSEQTLRALPKMKEVFELTTLLGLGEIALGTPTALLHTTHRRMLAIAHSILEATATKPSLIVLEAPFVGLNEQQRAGLQQVVEHPLFREHVAWIGVEG